MSLKIVCDNCNSEIRSLSTRPKENNGVEVKIRNEKKHICGKCITRVLTRKNEQEKNNIENGQNQ